MEKILYDIKGFIGCLKSGGLKVLSHGYFSKRGRFRSVITKYFGFNQHLWVKASSAFREALEELESVPVSFNQCEKDAVQEFCFKDFIEAGNTLLQKLSAFQSVAVKKEVVALRRSLLALCFREEECNGGKALSSVSDELFSSLSQAAILWKSSQVVFHDFNLSLDDIRKLQTTCQYREAAELLLEDETLLNDFFRWSIRDGLPIEVFIEFPSLAKKIVDFDLNGRVARQGGLKVLKVPNENGSDGSFKKIVTLPFEGRDTNVLDESRYVLFRGNYALTIKEVFEEFAKKKRGSSNLEYMREGVINWNSFLWGWWNADLQEWQLLDLDKEKWWEQLPCFEVLTLKEARKRFGSHLDGRQWSVSAVATRERATLDFEGAHAYSSIAIPMGSGKYTVLPFGKYAFEFPETLLQAFLRVGETSRATVVFPDENVYYTHRQRGRLSFALREDQAKACLASIKQDMLVSRAGNLVYQIESENCAKWVCEKIEEVVGPHRIPNVFQMPFLSSEPHGIMEKIFKAVKSLPKPWQIPLTLGIHYIFGGYKGVWIWEEGKRVLKALNQHSFWRDTVIYHPSMLHKQQERGIFKSFVSEGVTFCKKLIYTSYCDVVHKMVLFADFVEKFASNVSECIKRVNENKARSTLILFFIQFFATHPFSKNIGGEGVQRCFGQVVGMELAVVKSLSLSKIKIRV